MSVHEGVKQVGDALSIAVAGATLLKWLPAIAAGFTIIWTGIRIWETDTVKRLTGRKPPD